MSSSRFVACVVELWNETNRRREPDEEIGVKSGEKIQINMMAHSHYNVVAENGMDFGFAQIASDISFSVW